MRFLEEDLDLPNYIELDYDDIEVETEEGTRTVSWVYKAPTDSVVDFLIDKVPDNVEEEDVDDYFNDNLDDLVETYWDELLDYFRDSAEEDARDYNWDKHFEDEAYWADADRAWEEKGLDEGFTEDKSPDAYLQSLAIGFKNQNKQLFKDIEDGVKDIDEVVEEISSKSNILTKDMWDLIIRSAIVSNDAPVINEEVEDLGSIDDELYVDNDDIKVEFADDNKEILLDDVSDEELFEVEKLSENVIKEQNKTLVNVETAGGGTSVNVSVDTNIDDEEPVIDYVNENISQTAEIKEK